MTCFIKFFSSFFLQLHGQRHVSNACVGCQQPVYPTQTLGIVTVQHTWIQQWYDPHIILERGVKET